MRKRMNKLACIMSMCAILVSGCAATGTDNTENSTAATGEGGVVNIYCWNDEFK